MTKSKKILLSSAVALALAPLASAQTYTTVVQFFNNNPSATVEGLPSSDYNWASVNANGVATEMLEDVSRGNTGRGGFALPGERPLGSGFMFSVPLSNSDVPGASMFFTRHTGVSNDYQPNPQPDWFATSGTGWLSGATTGDLVGISFRSNSGSNNNFQAHIAFEVDGIGWVVSPTAHTLTTDWTIFNQAIDLSTDQWITGVFDGTSTLLADPSGQPTIPLTGNELVTGFGLYAITGAIAGNSSRVRVDLYGVEVIPEPSTYALIFGFLALAGVALRRRLNRR